MERVTSFDYTNTILRPIDEKTIKAQVENQVVTVTAKIAEVDKPKKIPLKQKVDNLFSIINKLTWQVDLIYKYLNEQEIISLRK